MRTIILMLLPLFAMGQRDITYEPADSMFRVPKERLVLIQQRLLHYDILLPYADSVSELSNRQIVEIENLQEALERAKEPNIFERLGYAVSAGAVRLVLSIIEKTSTK